MSLFDEFERLDEGPSLYAEPAFEFLNRSARPVSDRIRVELESWFLRYPTAEQPDLRGRFRSPNDSHHHSAFFELFLHELLLRMECLVEVHPSAPKSTEKKPDFRVEPPDESPFYLEAVLATDESEEEAAAQARINEVYDALNRLDSPGFYIGMNLSGAPKTPPPAKKIRSFLAQRLSQVIPGEIESLLKSGDHTALPHWRYEHEGWRIDFFPIPKSSKTRGKSDVRPLARWSHEMKWSTSRTVIRDAIVSKGGHYGKLDLPFVIAVNSLGDPLDRIDTMEALYGKEQWTVQFSPSTPAMPENTSMTRAPDGAWTSKTGPRYSRVSAVLIADRLSPWNVPRASVRLYQNPWANRPYEGPLTQLPQAVPTDEGRIEWRSGESLGDIFGLPPGWPEE